MSWHFSRALVEEFLGDICSDGERSLLLNLMNIAEKFSCDDKMMDVSNRFPYGMTLKHSDETTQKRPMLSMLWKKWMISLLQQDFHVSRIPLPDQGRDQVMSGICGQTQYGLCVKWDANLRCWKMYRGFKTTIISAKSSVTWSTLGTMRNGMLYPLPRLELAIREKDFGFSHTNDELTLMEWILKQQTKANVQTPTATYGLRAYSHSGHEALMWKMKGDVGYGPLNPDWIEWLMGWPIGWTACTPLETDKFHLWLYLHFYVLQKELVLTKRPL